MMTRAEQRRYERRYRPSRRQCWKGWRRRRAIALGLQENVEIAGCRQWAIYTVLFPGRALRWARRRFLLWTVLPGDRFDDIMLAETYEVVTVKPGYVVAKVTDDLYGTAGGYVRAWRDDRMLEFPVSAERVMRRWWPA